MRLFPEAPDEANSNLQWGVQELLRIVEEVVYESPVFQADESDFDEVWDRIVRAWEERRPNTGRGGRCGRDEGWG